jgi:hypothetical protein
VPLLREERLGADVPDRGEGERPQHGEQDVDAQRTEHRADIDHSPSEQRLDDHDRRSSHEEQVQQEERASDVAHPEEHGHDAGDQPDQDDEESDPEEVPVGAGGVERREQGGALEHDRHEGHPVAGRPRGEEDERGEEQDQDDPEAVRGHARRGGGIGRGRGAHEIQARALLQRHVISSTPQSARRNTQKGARASGRRRGRVMRLPRFGMDRSCSLVE